MMPVEPSKPMIITLEEKMTAPYKARKFVLILDNYTFELGLSEMERLKGLVDLFFDKGGVYITR